MYKGSFMLYCWIPQLLLKLSYIYLAPREKGMLDVEMLIVDEHQLLGYSLWMKQANDVSTQTHQEKERLNN